MAPHELQDRSIRSIILSTIIIMILIVLGLVVAVAGIDAACLNTVETWLPYYPDAEVESVEYDLFRPRAMGNSLITLSSDDDRRLVLDWYADHQARLREANTPEGIATFGFNIRDRDGGGVTIYLFSECAYN